MQFFKDLEAKIEAAKPVLHHAVSRADLYACRIIDLLEEIADATTIEDQRIKRVALTNGNAVELEIPPGENWKMISMIVEPAAATVVTLKLGGISRFAKNFAAADTPLIEGIIVSSGSTFTLLSTGADAIVTIIAMMKRRRPPRVRFAGEKNPLGLPANDGNTPTRHYTDEATELPPPPTDADEIALQQTAASDNNGYQPDDLL